jgi:hypothetical protein
MLRRMFAAARHTSLADEGVSVTSDVWRTLFHVHAHSRWPQIIERIQHEWCPHSEYNVDLRTRFKAVAMVEHQMR